MTRPFHSWQLRSVSSIKHYLQYALWCTMAVQEGSSDESRIGVLLDLSWLFFTKIDRRKWVSSFLELLSPNLQ